MNSESSGQEKSESPLGRTMAPVGHSNPTGRISVIDLPDEILADILGMFVDCERKVDDEWESDMPLFSSTCRALQLSSVCRRFRFVLLGMRGAWAVVTSFNPGQQLLTMCSERSLDKGLCVYFGVFGITCDLKLLRNMIRARPACRITSISVEVDIYPAYEPVWVKFKCEQEVMQLMERLDNSILESVHINYTRQFRFCDNIDDGEETETIREGDGGLVSYTRRIPCELRHLLLSPKLSSASFVNAIPPVGIMNLSKLSIRLEDTDSRGYLWEDDGERVWNAQSLVDLLHSLSTLEDFSLEFYEAWSFSFDGCTDKIVDFPSIRNVELRWHASSSNLHWESDLACLFGRLNLKNVKTFYFELFPARALPEYDSDYDYEMSLDSELKAHLAFFLSQDTNYFPLLDTFRLKLHLENTANIVHLPASFIQNIKHLSLCINVDVAFCDPEDEPDRHAGIPGDLTQLETVTLQYCDTFTTETVRYIVAAIVELGCWEKFKRLLVDQCNLLSRSSLEDFIEPEKLEVYLDARTSADSWSEY